MTELKKPIKVKIINQESLCCGEIGYLTRIEGDFCYVKLLSNEENSSHLFRPYEFEVITREEK